MATTKKPSASDSLDITTIIKPAFCGILVYDNWRWHDTQVERIYGGSHEIVEARLIEREHALRAQYLEWVAEEAEKPAVRDDRLD